MGRGFGDLLMYKLRVVLYIYFPEATLKSCSFYRNYSDLGSALLIKSSEFFCTFSKAQRTLQYYEFNMHSQWLLVRVYRFCGHSLQFRPGGLHVHLGRLDAVAYKVTLVHF